MTQSVLSPTAQSQISIQGLSQSEIKSRIDQGQTNNYKARVSRTYWDIVRDNLLNLFNIVLGTLLVIVIALGDYATAFFAGFSVVTNTFLGMIQEINAKRKLDQLAAMGEQQVTVIRGGERTVIPMHEVVLDDVIAIAPGDKIVVDGVIVKADSLEVDESLLTGESDAVFKQLDAEVFSGSFCIAGAGLMKATRVGKDSNINKLSDIAKQYTRVKTPTQTYIDIIVEVTVLVMFVFVPMLFVTAYLQDLTVLNSIRNAVVFVTSLVPQGLVLVAILSLTIGAIKITRQYETLIQRVNAVESLANATVLCFDKTGTLTMNKLAVDQIISLDGSAQEEISHHLWQYLHNLAHLNRTAGAVQQYVEGHIGGNSALKQKTKEIPFNSTRKWGAVTFDDATYVMGAPERILPQRTSNDSVVSRATKLALQGLRVLAFARVEGELDSSQEQISQQCDPIALIVLSDQIRGDIQETLNAFRQEDLRLKVISGDSIETVQAVARESGMDAEKAYTGAQLDAMADSELQAVVMETDVFGRVEPDTKRRIVKALQAQGQYVAMVGDGVNDVPALKQAQLAIVMNDGTQISKDVADIVLLNNAMSTLPHAFAEGKETTQTIFGTMKMFLVKNFYNVALFLFVGFMSLPFPITPIQISWSTFGTVNMPATLVAFGLLRPKFMRNFRDDVLDYIITVGFIGAVLLAVLYVAVYFGTHGDVIAVRSAITLFLCFYGALIVLTIQGVDFYHPQTFREHWRTVVMMIVFTTLTILHMYALPGLFEFKQFSWADDWQIIILITALFCLSIVLVAHGSKYRYLLKRFYRLFQR
ncbi:MAG: HAD-IC family P-type ATPase [Anaerolineaceae bacterium]|nr:HAD-IC family P-type ATPase [Anaerolineaceae bacterium]